MIKRNEIQVINEPRYQAVSEKQGNVHSCDNKEEAEHQQAIFDLADFLEPALSIPDALCVAERLVYNKEALFNFLGVIGPDPLIITHSGPVDNVGLKSSIKDLARDIDDPEDSYETHEKSCPFEGAWPDTKFHKWCAMDINGDWLFYSSIPVFNGKGWIEDGFETGPIISASHVGPKYAYHLAAYTLTSKLEGDQS